MSTRTALVTGATGHVGARLVPALLDAGWRVRVLSRNPGKLAPAWRDRVEVTAGDATRTSDVLRALDGVEVAYYMLHSMDGRGDYRRRDRELAETFAAAALASDPAAYYGTIAAQVEEADDAATTPAASSTGKRSIPAPTAPPQSRKAPLIGSPG